MRNNRIFTMLIVFTMLVSSFCVNVSAHTTLSDKEIMELKAFRILETVTIPEKNISRAEFARLTVRLINREELAYIIGTKQIPSDVDITHSSSAAIAVLYSLGIISGDGSSCFYPERIISYDEALKILVSALGYDVYAKQQGGFPTGYVGVAQKLGIPKNVVADGELTYTDAMKLFYNCLDVPLMEYTMWDDSYVKTSTTFRDILMGNQNVGMVKLRGVIRANYDCYLDNEIPDIEPNEVQFFDVVVNKGNTNADDYLGYETDVFLSTDNDNKYTIESIIPTQNNESFTVDFEDISIFTDTMISYFEGKELKKYELNNAKIIFNGRPTDIQTAITNMENGTATFISNDGDKKIDVVLINSYVSGVIENISYDSKFFMLGGDKSINGQRGLRFDDKNENLHFYFESNDRKILSPEKIKKGELVSVFSDLNGELIRVVKGGENVRGKIEALEIDDTTVITIDGKKYKGEKNSLSNVKVGDSICAMLNFEGKIGDVKELKSNTNYGAIVAVSNATLSKNTEVKILIPGNIADETEDAEDPDDDQIVSLAAMNSDVQVFSIADKVKYFENRISDEDAYTKIHNVLNSSKSYIIEYVLNSKGEISSISVPEEIGTGYSKRYNSDERTFGATAGGAFGVCDSTLAICVPSNIVESDDDYLTKIKMNDGQNYYVNSYELNDDTHCADLVVIKEVMHYETTGAITTSSDIGLVDKIENKKNENGDFVQYITFITKDGKKEAEISDHTTSKFNFNSLKKGDFIYYSIDPLDKIDGAEKILSSLPIPGDYISSGRYNLYVGNITDVDYDIVSETLNRWIDKIYFETRDGRTATFEVRQKGTPPIYIYDTDGKSASKGERLDLMRSHQKVAICTVGSTVKAVLIIV